MAGDAERGEVVAACRLQIHDADRELPLGRLAHEPKTREHGQRRPHHQKRAGAVEGRPGGVEHGSWNAAAEEDDAAALVNKAHGCHC